MNGRWIPHDVRDAIVDFVRESHQKTQIPIGKYLKWTGLYGAKFSEWKKRYGKVNAHNAWIPQDHWIEPWEKEAVLSYYQTHPLEGYRRLAFMMLDENVVALSPSSVYRILCQAGVMRHWNRKVSKKGSGFEQPEYPHKHWHIDVSYLNIASTFYYLCCVLDGYSRYIVHWDIGEQMREENVEIILERAREKFPDVHPRIISDNGPQFIAKDFKEYIRISAMTHVRTSPNYPQSNGKIERFHQTIKGDCRFCV